MKKLYMHEAFPGKVDRPVSWPMKQIPEPEVEIDEYPYQILIRSLEDPDPVSKLGFKNEASARTTFTLIVNGIEKRGETRTVTLFHEDEVLEIY